MFTQDEYVIIVEIAAVFGVKYGYSMQSLHYFSWRHFYLEFLKRFFPAEFNFNSQHTVLHWCSMIGSLFIPVHSSTSPAFR